METYDEPQDTILQKAVFLMIQELGFQQIDIFTLNFITDTVEQYMKIITDRAQELAKESGKTTADLEDLALILPKHNASVEGLKEHFKNVGIRPVLKHKNEIYIPQLEAEKKKVKRVETTNRPKRARDMPVTEKLALPRKEPRKKKFGPQYVPLLEDLGLPKEELPQQKIEHLNMPVIEELDISKEDLAQQIIGPLDMPAIEELVLPKEELQHKITGPLDMPAPENLCLPKEKEENRTKLNDLQDMPGLYDSNLPTIEATTKSVASAHIQNKEAQCDELHPIQELLLDFLELPKLGELDGNISSYLPNTQWNCNANQEQKVDGMMKLPPYLLELPHYANFDMDTSSCCRSSQWIQDDYPELKTPPYAKTPEYISSIDAFLDENQKDIFAIPTGASASPPMMPDLPTSAQLFHPANLEKEKHGDKRKREKDEDDRKPFKKRRNLKIENKNVEKIKKNGEKERHTEIEGPKKIKRKERRAEKQKEMEIEKERERQKAKDRERRKERERQKGIERKGRESEKTKLMEKERERGRDIEKGRERQKEIKGKGREVQKQKPMENDKERERAKDRERRKERERQKEIERKEREVEKQKQLEREKQKEIERKGREVEKQKKMEKERREVERQKQMRRDQTKEKEKLIRTTTSITGKSIKLIIKPPKKPEKKHYYIENGVEIWICPQCEKQDDGTLMIGCDGCQLWYHIACIELKAIPPHEEKWYCQHCHLKNSRM
ncbi:remodeling and spacing factor 1-like [Belonocnema kinseyi]|uniref:remodeling and spacing factor 1-like n=1 Tax=Belonocnema kinseyi TaxID=2817044 RepID=UPI00143DFE70|nr:remodeling and spacing factor 1-like [Belonocnema kinseyi]